ncbi:hypothetical protein PC114_g18083 [Phytophthora cactorum]|nr:hypothetical protein PC114_g18083 [Phytophthora cactorum]
MPTTRYKAYPRHVRAHVLRVAKEAGDWKTVADIYDVKERTAWGWIKAAMDTGDWSGNQKQRGGSPKKILDAHVDYLRDELSKTPELTLAQMAELVEQKFDVTVSRETVRRALDARSFTVKKLHRDVINRNNPINKQKRSDYVIKFYAALANNKRHESCLPGVTVRLVHGRIANEFIRHFLRYIRTTTSLDEVVVVLDNAPCHTSAKDVFEEEEFHDAEMLKLGPYSPMLNHIENVFSAYKSAVKRFLARQRPAILRVPEDTTITEHRARYLELAADPLFEELVTPDLCNRAFCHSLHHHQRALRFEDMEVGM